MFRIRQLVTILSSPHLTHRRFIQTHPLFAHEQLADNVWRIEEKYFDSWKFCQQMTLISDFEIAIVKTIWHFFT